MDVKNRLGRGVATSVVALFLVSGAVLGANAIASAPARSIDATLTTSDQSAQPADIAEPTEIVEPTDTAEPTETADDHSGDSGGDSSSDRSGHD